METDRTNILNVCFDEVDFGNGVRQDNQILSVRWSDGVYLKIQNSWVYHVTIERDEYIFKHQIFRKEDDQLLLCLKRWAKDISDGRYKTKKTGRERIFDIIVKRNLTSYMNDTKWQEFRIAMLKEMPFQPPYDYKTLFDDSDYIDRGHVHHLIKKEGPHYFCSFDEESFNFLLYKAIEWVKVRPRFFTQEGGQLVKKKIWHDSEIEFIDILRKYNIPYELENGVYTIYGYK
ncbi:DUF6678 family protein [Lacrimispora sp.]|uniref:DUF6678 family protein n=1 Tax=Lacrimispora sp. TaxID=2719234 RepID=UPI0028B266A6|nr:DUF6678 family protein [Lacrimispora sp.]